MEEGDQQQNSGQGHLQSRYEYLLSLLDAIAARAIAIVEEDASKDGVASSQSKVARELDDLAISFKTWGGDLTLAEPPLERLKELLTPSDMLPVLEVCRAPLSSDMHKLFDHIQDNANKIDAALKDSYKDTLRL